MVRRKLFSPRSKTPTKSHHHAPRRRHRPHFCVEDTLCAEVTKELRTELWLSVLQQPGIHSEAQASYVSFLLQEIPESVAESIEKDVGRTFPDLKEFSTEEGQESMKNVLSAYAAYDKEVGYCQGMNFVAGLLLVYLPDEAEAFGALVLLMKEQGLRDLYTTDMSLLEVHLYHLSKLLPASLLSHLESLGALPVLFASSWFLTCFAAAFPLDIAALVMDIVLCDSSSAFLLKMAYMFIKTNESILMSLSRMEDIITFMTSTLPSWETIHLQAIVLEALQTPWRKAQRSILKDPSPIESVYDAVARVEGALISTESSASEEDSPRSKRNPVRRSHTPIAFIPQCVCNLKHNPLHHIHIPFQSFIRKIR